MIWLDVATLVPTFALGLNMLRHMSRMYDQIHLFESGLFIGPRLRWRTSRKAMRATGAWLVSVGATIAWMGIGVDGATTFGSYFGPFMIGALMWRFPQFFVGGLWLDARDRNDYKEPIGPAPDPMPHLRTPEALEEWLDGGLDQD